jgi:hypothetical protein
MHERGSCWRCFNCFIYVSLSSCLDHFWTPGVLQENKQVWPKFRRQQRAVELMLTGLCWIEFMWEIFHVMGAQKGNGASWVPCLFPTDPHKYLSTHPASYRYVHSVVSCRPARFVNTVIMWIDLSPMSGSEATSLKSKALPTGPRNSICIITPHASSLANCKERCGGGGGACVSI